jgi:methionyl-tRNA formyltransferase
MPALGTFNLHASPSTIVELHPYNWAIINGETKNRASLFIDDKIDTGAMILTKFY